jgi:hypothetical protein|nr:MAG TPA: hypothetical protein [Caudoviricetes sp.]
MVLKLVKMDKALVLGNAMAMIEVVKEVRGYTLNNIYVPPEKMIKLIHPTSKISQLWLSRLKSMKTNKHFSLKVLRDLTENKNLVYLKKVLDNVNTPETEEEIELKKFLCFFYQLDDREFDIFIVLAYEYCIERIEHYRSTVDKESQTPVTA